jgi:hypothetical protein
LYLSLRGDFDGTSAYELLHNIKDQSVGVAEVFIDTSGLNEIYAFGRDTLNSNLCLLKGKEFRLEFTGSKAGKIAPEVTRLRRLLQSFSP